MERRFVLAVVTIALPTALAGVVGLAAPAGAATTHLSDLAVSSAVSGWGPVERDRSNGEQAAGDGRVLTLQGQTFAKGLGVHAASDVRWVVPSGCSRFAATVGVDDEVGSAGSVVFQVFDGAARVFDSGVLRGSSASVPVSVPVTAGGSLRLVVTDAGDGPGHDHADWADARLLCASVTPTGPTFAVVGDMACATSDAAFNAGAGSGNRCRQRAVSDLVLDPRITAVITVGDNQYESGELAQFRASYEPSFGRVKAKTHPTCGNHEYQTPGAQGFVDYFGRSCQWSTTLLAPGVRVVLLDTNVAMHAGSPQHTFVRDTLVASGSTCVFLAGHHPRYSTGPHGDNRAVDALWDLGVQHGAAAMFSGHDHSAQRFAPRGADDAVSGSGMVQIVSGAGGKSIYPAATTSAAQERYITVPGVYEITPDVAARSFGWLYRGIDGQVHDRGTASCRR